MNRNVASAKINTSWILTSMSLVICRQIVKWFNDNVSGVGRPHTILLITYCQMQATGALWYNLHHPPFPAKSFVRLRGSDVSGRLSAYMEICPLDAKDSALSATWRNLCKSGHLYLNTMYDYGFTWITMWCMTISHI